MPERYENRLFAVPTFSRGPRTRLFYIVLYLNGLQKSDVRGPFTEGRLCARGINPSAATESRTHTFPGYPCHSERSEESGVKIWSRGTVVVLQILHSACGCVYGDRKWLRSGQGGGSSPEHRFYPGCYGCEGSAINVYDDMGCGFVDRTSGFHKAFYPLPECLLFP